MFGSAKRVLHFVFPLTFAGVIGLGVPRGTLAQRSIAGSLPTVRALIEAAYPLFVGSDSDVGVTLQSPFNREWLSSGDIVIRLNSNLCQSRTNLASYPQFDQDLTAHFWFDRERLERATFAGRCVRSAEMASLTTELEAHPEWTERELSAALRTVDAKFGPERKQSFVEVLQLSRFAPALGTVRVQDVVFRWRLGRSDLGAADITTPSWQVKIRTSGAGRASGCYSLFFEPISGSLRSIITGGCE